MGAMSDTRERSSPTEDATPTPLGEATEQALTEYLPLVYADLHELARRLMARERPDHTLQATALVHEMFVRLWDETGGRYRDQAHFYRVAARSMRRILVDFARRRSRRPEEAGDSGAAAAQGHPEDSSPDALCLLAVEDALRKLQAMDAALTEVVELRFFAGLEHRQIAELLGTSVRSVERHWALARAWLERELSRDGPS